MGNNFAYTIFEETVVRSYDLDKLDKELLGVLMEPYRDTDIDSGGSRGLTSKDGLCVEEIVVKTWGGQLPEKPWCASNKNPSEWTDEEDEESGNYRSAVYDLFREVTRHFRWC